MQEKWEELKTMSLKEITEFIRELQVHIQDTTLESYQQKMFQANIMYACGVRDCLRWVAEGAGVELRL